MRMVITAGAVQFLLINISLFAIYAIWILFGANGTGQMLSTSKEAGLLPGSTIPYKPFYTGLPQFDSFMVTLNTFFWSIVDGSSPTLSLFTFQFGGQVIALYSLTVLEGVRAGNQSRINS